MYVNEKRDMHLAELKDEEYLDRMGKSVEDITEILRQQDYSTWDGFGSLFQWAKEQDWWLDFLQENGMVLEKKGENEDDNSTITETFEYFPVNLLDPDEFADAIVAFLDDLEEQKEKENQDNDKVMVVCNGSNMIGCRKDIVGAGCDHYNKHEHDPSKCYTRYCQYVRKSVTCPINQTGEAPSTITKPVTGGDVWST